VGVSTHRNIRPASTHTIKNACSILQDLITYVYFMNIQHKRQGQMETASCYFYTDTIFEFKHLLKEDDMKMLCINSWKYLVNAGLIKIYGYVIMPNHVHLVWKMLTDNGKESPAGSFAKYTAHQFKKILSVKDKLLLEQYASSKADRKYQFWKRDPLAIPLHSDGIILQKLDYIHHNPVKEKWQLADLPEHYRWSSASFYLGNRDEFGILTHYMD
jgi:putative transposase